MSKFIIQLLLSLVIGVGAAVGFRTDAKGELNKAWREAKVKTRQAADINIKSISDLKTQVNTAVSISANGDGGVSTKVTARADANGKGDLNPQVSNDTQVNAGGAASADLVPNASVEGTLNTNSQTNLQAGIQDLDLDLKNRTKSKSELELNLK